MDPERLRAWWFHRQGLDGDLKTRSIAGSLIQCGWARSVGGSGPYLGFFSRVGASRQAVDDAIAKAEIHELPAARGCTYVVAAADYALALRCGAPFAESELKVARSLGVTDEEVASLGEAVARELRQGPLDPDGLKAVLGAKVRSLGEAGKKKGITTTLPLALGLLQTQGRIRRVPINGRLDQQRYRYALWEPSPLEKSTVSQEEAFVELARRYFDWTGPASLAEFQWFSGLGVKAAKAAIEPLKPIVLDGGLLVPPSLADDFAAFELPVEPSYALVSSIDSALLLRRNVKSVIAEQDIRTLVQGERGRIELGSIADLPSHAIFDRGLLIGLWEFDPETSTIAWASFRKPDAALKMAVRKMEAFVRDDLGDARAFSLDSPKSRAPRIAALLS